jgi:hypothetical protein
MKTKYKFIYFEEVENDMFPEEKKIWWVKNNRSKSRIGSIEWYPPWSQYCFMPESQTVFNNTCLADIQNFIGQLK